MKQPDPAETILFPSADAFDQWLAKNYDRTEGVWIKMAKLSSGIPSITIDETVDVGLCWGWISGQRKPLDETYYLQKYVPRRPKGLWSKVNVEKIEMLTAAGRMQPQGIAEVEAAKADGRWAAAYDSSRTMTVPEDFQAELDKHPKAQEFFLTLNKANWYAILFRIQTAKKPETRSSWITKIITMLEAGEVFH